jgi:hypothetical protein
MKQLSFFEDFYSPMEVGWWIMYSLENQIQKDPNSVHTVFNEKTGTAICGSIPNECNGKKQVHLINNEIYGNGNLLHLTRNVR